MEIIGAFQSDCVLVDGELVPSAKAGEGHDFLELVNIPDDELDEILGTLHPGRSPPSTLPISRFALYQSLLSSYVPFASVCTGSQSTCTATGPAPPRTEAPSGNCAVKPAVVWRTGRHPCSEAGSKCSPLLSRGLMVPPLSAQHTLTLQVVSSYPPFPFSDPQNHKHCLVATNILFVFTFDGPYLAHH
jgi:hypothetical protein